VKMQFMSSPKVCDSTQTRCEDADFNNLYAGFRDSSVLLKHELAYCLGQMKMTSALPALERTLRDTSEDPMVRHEVSAGQTNVAVMNLGSG
jgi:HEAT repeat protein